MRKLIAILSALAVFCCTTIFAASYVNNKYQKLAEEYTEKAQKALDAGHYDLVSEYSAEAEKNAALSEEFIRMMLARTKAEEDIAAAEKIVSDATERDAETLYPEELAKANESLSKAKDYFEGEDYENASDSAKKVKDFLTDDILADLDDKYSAKQNALASQTDSTQKAIDSAADRLNLFKTLGGDSVYPEEGKKASDLLDSARQNLKDGKFDEASRDAKDAYGTITDDMLEALRAKAAKEIEDAAAAENARSSAEANLAAAKERYDLFKSLNGESVYPVVASESKELLSGAESDITNGKLDDANSKAASVFDLITDDLIDALRAKAAADALNNAAQEENGSETEGGNASENAKAVAEADIESAKERLAYIKSIGGDDSYPAVLKQAADYIAQAEAEFNGENYDAASESAQSALALLNDDLVSAILLKSNADEAISAAKARIEFVKTINGDKNYPIAFNAASEYMKQAEAAYSAEEYEKAIASARQVLEALAEVHELVPLPKFYIVRPWAETKDCFWNISGRPYVYNNPFLWENLYEANKDNIPDRNNPNLILPGMKMEIPSISGEYRDGVYSPDVNYDAYNAAR